MGKMLGLSGKPIRLRKGMLVFAQSRDGLCLSAFLAGVIGYCVLRLFRKVRRFMILAHPEMAKNSDWPRMNRFSIPGKLFQGMFVATLDQCLQGDALERKLRVNDLAFDGFTIWVCFICIGIGVSRYPTGAGIGADPMLAADHYLINAGGFDIAHFMLFYFLIILTILGLRPPKGIEMKTILGISISTIPDWWPYVAIPILAFGGSFVTFFSEELWLIAIPPAVAIMIRIIQRLLAKTL